MTLQTRTKDSFDFRQPRFDIKDIAHAPPNICRFNGHCSPFFSVAQHCLLVAQHVPEEQRWSALLSDAHVVYVGDLTYPVQSLVPEWKALRYSIREQLLAHFKIAITPEIEEANMRALATERRDLFDTQESEWPLIDGVEPYPESITGATSPHAASIIYRNMLKDAAPKGFKL